MTNDIGENFLLYGTTKEIWDATKETYSNNENTLELFEVESVLHDFRQGELTVTQYFNTLNRYWQQLDLFEEHNWSCPGDGIRAQPLQLENPFNNNDHKPKKGDHGVIIADVWSHQGHCWRIHGKLRLEAFRFANDKEGRATSSPWMKNHYPNPLPSQGTDRNVFGLYLLEVNDPPQGSTHHFDCSGPVVLFLLFLMKEKSEANQIFKTFNPMIQTQFQYFNSILNDYLLSHGIVHQSSCVNTPQQNAILTAYLINRMPSRILDFQTPCQILLQSFPNTRLISTIPFKVLVLTFVHVHQQHRTNLILKLLNVFSLEYQLWDIEESSHFSPNSTNPTHH
ncbi:hypothetical protein AAG906_041112 [Vitis piasezkii]